MGDCQNYGPFLGTLNIRGRIIIGTQKGIIILTTTHICLEYTSYPTVSDWGQYPRNRAWGVCYTQMVG